MYSRDKTSILFLVVWFLWLLEYIGLHAILQTKNRPRRLLIALNFDAIEKHSCCALQVAHRFRFQLAVFVNVAWFFIEFEPVQ